MKKECKAKYSNGCRTYSLQLKGLSQELQETVCYWSILLQFALNIMAQCFIMMNGYPVALSFQNVRIWVKISSREQL